MDKSTVELAEAAYYAGWKAAIAAVARLVEAAPPNDRVQMIIAMAELRIVLSPTLVRMREALK